MSAVEPGGDLYRSLLSRGERRPAAAMVVDVDEARQDPRAIEVDVRRPCGPRAKSGDPVTADFEPARPDHLIGEDKAAPADQHVAVRSSARKRDAKAAVIQIGSVMAVP
ncbi:MAG: hypothetical protein ACRDOD_25945, partial [Streptosporangiaceae bacterium]